MKRSKKRGFTLVELLAVIVILAIILVIAVPKVMSVIEDAKKATLESTAKMIASQAEKQKVQNTVLGNDKAITCEDITNINDVDYEDCDIAFDNNTAKVTIIGSGKFEGLYVCNGDKTDAVATKDSCRPVVPVLNCTYDGELVQGTEFVHNQYTYRYKQEYDVEAYAVRVSWQDIETDGWHVRLTDLESTAPVNTPICTYINGKPLVSMSYMFEEGYDGDYNLISSQAESIDVSLWNTSTVTNMSHMFEYSAATSLDLSSFDTSNVTDMNSMFNCSAATSLDLSSFDTSNVTYMNSMFNRSAATSLDLSSFDTSNVTDMNSMFGGSAATSLDLSSFDTSNVTSMGSMFFGSAATSLDLSSFDTSNVTDMYDMFFKSAATTIYIGDKWNTSNVTSSSSMFTNATNIVGGNGTTYNSSYTDKTYARVDTASTPGYFTYKASN